jgi:hypothetical protein
VNAKLLLDDLRGRGVRIETDGERLLIDAPACVITDELKAALSKHKARVIGVLEFEQRFQRSEREQEDDGRRFDARPSRHPGYTSLYDPIEGEWHDFPTRDCYPSVVDLARSRRRGKGRAV